MHQNDQRGSGLVLSDLPMPVLWMRLFLGIDAFLLGASVAMLNPGQIEAFHLWMLILCLALLTGVSIGLWSP